MEIIGHSVIRGLDTEGQWSAVDSAIYSRESKQLSKAAGGRMASAVRGSSAKRKLDLRRRSGYGVPVQTEKSLEKLNKKALLSVGKQGFFILGCCPKF